MSIRSYRPDDLERVLEIWYAASIDATPFLTAEFLTQERHQIRHVWMPQAESWVWESDGTVVGFIALIGHEVGGIFVHPDYQGRGCGTALMDHALALRGRVGLDVFEENHIGRRFYKRYGFREVGHDVHEGTGHRRLRLEYGT